jgi:hypothetical protein
MRLTGRTFIISLIVLLSLSGCTKAQNDYSQIAGINPEFQVAVNDEGTISIQGKPDKSYDFTGWEDIISVSAGVLNIAGIKNDGTVLVTGKKDWGACNVEDWINIVMVEFTASAAFGLTENGQVVYTQSIEHMLEEDRIKSEVELWEDVIYIDAAQLFIAGVKANGEVVVAAPYAPELEGQIAEWKNVKSISTATFGISGCIITGLTYNGEILISAYDELHGRVDDAELIGLNDFDGVKELCANDGFLAGLMTDGTLIVRSVMNNILDDDFLALDGETNIVDINSYEDELVALKEDGTILFAGHTD